VFTYIFISGIQAYVEEISRVYVYLYLYVEEISCVYIYLYLWYTSICRGDIRCIRISLSL